MQETFFSQIRGQLSRELPFCVYRKPDAAGVVALLQEDDQLHSGAELERPGFVFSAFDDSEDCILIPLENSEKLELESFELHTSSFSARSSEASPKNTAKGILSENSEAKHQHLGLVERGIVSLKAGVLEKVVLSRKELVPIKEEDPVVLFQELLATYASAFVYLWFHPKVGLWLGATPETLLQVEGFNFKTMALAATQKYSGSLEVEWGDKEKQEQQFVTDSIKESLEGLEVVQELRLSEPFTSRAGGLVHIRTDISGRLKTGNHLKQVVQALHPTPAVCGLPKDKAKEFILEEEYYDREYYTGFLGELNFQKSSNRSRNRRNTENLAYTTVKRSSSLFVNLRCMKLRKGNAELFIGGGITRDSDPESEWQETQNKAQTMKKVILK